MRNVSRHVWRVALTAARGMSTSPLLSADGAVRMADGYDCATGLWCRGVPELRLPSRPSRVDAEGPGCCCAKHFGRFRLRTRRGAGIPTSGSRSSTLMNRRDGMRALFCRSADCSLSLEPMARTGVAMIGASGFRSRKRKGFVGPRDLRHRVWHTPRAFTSGGERQELDKRLAAELIEAQPAVFLDNANGLALRSDTLASVLTERPARVRLLGVAYGAAE